MGNVTSGGPGAGPNNNTNDPSRNSSKGVPGDVLNNVNKAPAPPGGVPGSAVAGTSGGPRSAFSFLGGSTSVIAGGGGPPVVPVVPGAAHRPSPPPAVVPVIDDLASIDLSIRSGASSPQHLDGTTSASSGNINTTSAIGAGSRFGFLNNSGAPQQGPSSTRGSAGSIIS